MRVAVREELFSFTNIVGSPFLEAIWAVKCFGGRLGGFAEDGLRALFRRRRTRARCDKGTLGFEASVGLRLRSRGILARGHGGR